MNLTGTIYDRQRLTGTLLSVLVQGEGLVFRGEYDAVTTYNKYDMVSLNKNLGLYKCTTNGTIGVHPGTLVNWELIMRFPFNNSSTKGGEKVVIVDPNTGDLVVSNVYSEYLITNKGIWNAIDNYAKGDFVSVPANLGWYISKVNDNNNVSPVGGNDNWQVVTEIPGGGIVRDDFNDANSEDLLPFNSLDQYMATYYRSKNDSLAKNLILAPADAWTPRQTNGATWQIDESTTNKQCKGVLIFSPSTEQAIQLEIKNLNAELITTANFKAKIHSKISGATDTGTGVVWGIRAALITDALDVNWNTDPDYNTTLSQTMTSGSAIYHTALSTAIKAAGELAANSSLLIEIYRKVAAAGDDMNASAAILDVEILINQ